MTLAILSAIATLFPLCADADRGQGCRVALVRQDLPARADAVQERDARSAPQTRY